MCVLCMRFVNQKWVSSEYCATPRVLEALRISCQRKQDALDCSLVPACSPAVRSRSGFCCQGLGLAGVQLALREMHGDRIPLVHLVCMWEVLSPKLLCLPDLSLQGFVWLRSYWLRLSRGCVTQLKGG